MSAHYYPLRPGRVMTYRTKSTGGEGALEIKTVSVASERGRVEAQCRSVGRGPAGTESARSYRVRVEVDALVNDGEVEFPLPPLPGRGWRRGAREYKVEALDGRVDTVAKAFDSCLVVLYTIAGGDAGIGRRYYAPEVGFVYETCADEGEPFEISLTGVREP